MKRVSRTTQFGRDAKRMQRRGQAMEKLKLVITKLARGELLHPRYRDHVLVGQYRGTRECHFEPDRLLIYESTVEELLLVRTGSHADLFR